jgi:hypothetical protein
MNNSGPSWRGLWALLWHSVVLLPFAAGLFAMFCYAWIGTFILPIAAGIFIWNSDWWPAMACLALWPFSLVCCRWVWKWERSDVSSHRGRV